MSIFRRILGVLLMIVGIVGLIIAGAVAYYGRVAVDTVAVTLNTTVQLLDDTVGTTVDSLENVKATLTEVTTTVDTVSDTVGNLSTTLFDTQPLLKQVTSLATVTVPDSLDAVQATIPNLAGIARGIDTTLGRLSNLKVERAILGVPISFDLGINYSPSEPFDQAVLQIGDSFVGVPEQLRTLEGSLTAAVDNLAIIGTNISDLSSDLTGVSGTITQFGPLLDQYIDVLNQTKVSLVQAQQQFESNLSMIKWVITGLGLWFALYQVVPLYIGWRMLTGKDDDDNDRPVVVAAGGPTINTTTADLDQTADHMVESAETLAEQKE